MKVSEIAKVAHQVNKAFCEAMGDHSQPEWENAPEWQRGSAILGVEYHLNNPDSSPEGSHNSWLEVKKKDGWRYGETKDPEAKTHPCYLPYSELPLEQKAKDYLFKEIVKQLS